MKKKILLITYYYFPLNAVSSYRAHSIYKYLSQSGFDVTLVTRHWKKEYTDWTDAIAHHNGEPEIIKDEQGTVIYLPYTVELKSHKNGFLNKAISFFSYFKGNLQPEVDAYSAFYSFLNDYLLENSFDAIFVTAPPNNIIKLGNKLAEKFNIPFFVDFRDFFNDQLFNDNYKLDLKLEILNKLSIWHIFKWVKRADLLISISPPFSKKIESIFKKKTITITNGYEKEFFENVQSIPNQKFTFRYIGSCSDMQNFSLIINGLKEFMIKHSNIEIELVGLMNDKVIQQFKANFDPSVLTVIENRVSKEDVINKIVNTDVLFFPSWKGYKGVYGTKIFEYLASGSFVLVAPGDNDVIDELMEETQIGKVVNSHTELLQVLEQQYEKWLAGNNKLIPGNSIDKYSRESVILDLSEKIRKAIND